jgi:hypothetical protein
MLRGSILSRGNGRLRPVSEYFPEIYGSYFIQQIPAAHITGSDSIVSGYFNPEKVVLMTEMELLDSDFEKYFAHKKIPDSVVFELALGEWAGANIAGMLIQDFKYRNVGLKEVDYYRAYHFGTEVILFPPGILPKRIDLDDLVLLKQSDKKSANSIGLVESDFESLEAKQFYKEIRQARRSKLLTDSGFLNKLAECFEGYKTTDDHLALIPPSKIKHFYIPDEYLQETENVGAIDAVRLLTEKGAE